MKKVLFVLFMTLVFFSCDDDQPTNIAEATILGRWVPEGFEDNVRYEFTSDKRVTIYGTDGDFPTLEEFLEINPQLTGNDWVYEGEVVVVDLNFGNYSRLIPNFKCDNKVIEWKNEDGTTHSTYYREDHDINQCN